MRKGGESDPRNKTLMKMFNLVNIGERSGSGVPNIFNTWEDQGWKEPVIEERFDPDRTILTLEFVDKTNKEKTAKKTSEENKRRKQAKKTSEGSTIRNKTIENMVKIENYLKEKMGLDDIHIIRRKIMKYQLIEEDGCRYYLVSAEELANAKQLVLGSKNVRFNRILNIIEDNGYNRYSPEYIQRGLDDFYEFLIGKIQKEFGRSSSVAEEIYDTKVFYKLESAKDKGDFIMEILKLTNIGSDYPYLKKYKKYNKISSSLIDRKGRSKYQGYKIKPGTVLIDQSVTGLYERRLEL